MITQSAIHREIKKKTLKIDNSNKFRSKKNVSNQTQKQYIKIPNVTSPIIQDKIKEQSV